MTERIGFDRPLRRDWLDFLAAQLANGVDPEEALTATRRLVGQVVSDNGKHSGAAGKTLSVLRRVWVNVPDEHRALRDRALGVLAAAGVDDRLAIHWVMCELAYPFFLGSAATVGRYFEANEAVTPIILRGRLAEHWGSRGTLPQTSKRLLLTWTAWGVLTPGMSVGQYAPVAPVLVSAPSAAIVAEARVRAAPNASMDVDALQRSPDLFAFSLPDVRDVLRCVPSVALVRQGGRGWVVRGI